MVKDRIQELQDNAEKYGDELNLSVINHFTTVDMEAPNFDDFFNRIEIIRNSNDNLVELIEYVNRIQNEILATPFINEFKHTLDAKTTEIKNIARQTRIQINQLKNLIELPNSQHMKTVQQRIISSQIDMITKHFCQIMNNYYQATIIYREKYKQRIQRQLQIVKDDRTIEETDELMKSNFLSMYPDIAVETQESKEKLDEMISRHQQLLELEEKIQEIHDIFFDMAYIVSSSADQIMYIDTKTEVAAEEVDTTGQYISAIRIPNRFRTNKLIGYIIIAIICFSFIIYLIIKFSMFF